MTHPDTAACMCGRPTAGAILCERCQTTLKWSMVNVAAYFVDLENVARKQTRYGSGEATKGSIGKTQPLPVDLRFLDADAAGSELRRDSVARIDVWVRLVRRQQAELHGPTCTDCLHVSCSGARRRRRPTSALPSQVAYLARHFRLVASQEWAPVMLAQMLDLERRLGRMVNRPADRWYAGKCSARDLLTDELCPAELYASEDSGLIECRVCGTRHDVHERREFLLEEAKEYQVTASEAARALQAWTDYDGSEKKLVDRIGKWRDRGSLEVQEVTSLQGRDRHLYRLGDIQELLVEHAQRSQQRRIGA